MHVAFRRLDAFAFADRVNQDARLGLCFGFRMDFLEHLGLVEAARLDVDAHHHQLRAGAHHDVFGVAIDERRRHVEWIGFDDFLGQRNGHLALDALVFAFQELLADLGAQIRQRIRFAAVFGQLVVERRHLAAADFLDRRAQADVLASQALHGRIGSHLVLDFQALAVNGNASQTLGQARHASGILVSEIHRDGAGLNLIVRHLAMHFDRQNVVGGRDLAIFDRLEFREPALVPLEGLLDLLVGDLGRTT